MGNKYYITLLQRKPGALRNGAPFTDLPAPRQRMGRALLLQRGGDRAMGQGRSDRAARQRAARFLALDRGAPAAGQGDRSLDAFGRPPDARGEVPGASRPGAFAFDASPVDHKLVLQLAELAASLAVLGIATALLLSALGDKLVLFFSPSDIAGKKAPAERTIS
jgi:hypothetical protein